MSKTTFFVTEIITRMIHNLTHLLQKRIKKSLIAGDERFIRQNVFLPHSQKNDVINLLSKRIRKKNRFLIIIEKSVTEELEHN